MCDYSLMDWALLREQKLDLLKHINDLDKGALEDDSIKKTQDSLIGILHLIDHVQDCAVDSGEFTEKEVFNLTEE